MFKVSEKKLQRPELDVIPVTCGSTTTVKSISKELYAILRNPGRFGGMVTWNCDSCAASALRLEKRMVAIESKFSEVEGRMEKNEMSVMAVEKRVDTVEKRQDKVEDMIAKERERARVERIEEMRERDVRKKNVVIHRIEEAGDWAKTREEGVGYQELQEHLHSP